jgi:hypothetical protein
MPHQRRVPCRSAQRIHMNCAARSLRTHQQPKSQQTYHRCGGLFFWPKMWNKSSLKYFGIS